MATEYLVQPCWFTVKIQPRAIYESVMPIFMYEGGYGAFDPAMLVYRENTTMVTRESTTRIFMHGGGYEAIGQAMLV